MQIYLKPYSHNTYCNVPYASEKRPTTTEQNYGFFNTKKYPGKIKQIPELKNLLELRSLVEIINKNSMFETYGVDFRLEPLGVHHSFWAWVNLDFAMLELNKQEELYYHLVGQFLKSYIDDNEDNAIIEFIINPTNFHDRERINKGVKPKEETIVFRGWSLNIKMMGVGNSIDEAKQKWNYSLNNIQNFLIEYETKN